MWDSQLRVMRFIEAINALAVERIGRGIQTIGLSPKIRDGELRARLIAEEAAETCSALTGKRWKVVETDEPVESSIELVADGCADITVVTLGAAVACGFDLEPVFDEVMSSNETKLTPGATIRAYANGARCAGDQATMCHADSSTLSAFR